MKTNCTLPLPLLVAALIPIALAAPVPPQIQNLVAAQRAGTMFVDITYDLIDPDSPDGVNILIEYSPDGGTNYNIPMRWLSGDVGLVRPGPGKKIAWNAWNDWATNYSNAARVRLLANDYPSTFGTINADNYTTNTPPTTNLVWVPSGVFQMGSADRVDERPLTLVYLTRGFWMGQYEVTQAEFQGVMGRNPSTFTGKPNRPVERVTWDDANQYCQNLTVSEQAAGRMPAGWAYRLPTEAEWEYAYRAGTTNTYYFGEDTNGTRLVFCAWYGANAGGQTHEAGQKAPNRWGLHDMAGNVWEWCSNWSAGTLPGGSVSDPQGPATGSFRSLRGGGYASASRDDCRAARRSAYPPSSVGTDMGFRVVLAPIP
jgi:formylglycine-generating enzyme required for sulfatase activity